MNPTTPPAVVQPGPARGYISDRDYHTSERRLFAQMAADADAPINDKEWLAWEAGQLDRLPGEAPKALARLARELVAEMVFLEVNTIDDLDCRRAVLMESDRDRSCETSQF